MMLELAFCTTGGRSTWTYPVHGRARCHDSGTWPALEEFIGTAVKNMRMIEKKQALFGIPSLCG
jgi:hypothetical protein